ncbi:unnamed protein product [Rotaria sordida]|uniref:ubiquitinyl hydrolase 1 n=1 Tax=Rotaria sordida TaxID=392033 RepID=A0A814TBG1_9BILA|nr:unnamed protein product [Rotaria sordida]
MNKSSSISSNRNSIPISACGDVKRFKSENSNLCTRVCVKKPEDIIICEKQEEHYCGRHVLRVLSQRLDLFCDEYLIEVVQNITAAEQICRYGEAIEIRDYYYESTGGYDIQILKAALMNTFNIDLIQIHTLEANTSSVQSLILSNIENVQDLLQSRSLCVDERALFTIWGKNRTSPHIVINFTQFLQNFTFAGGSVVLSLLMQAAAEKGSDVDLFFLKENPKMFRRAVNELEARLQNSYFVRHIVNGKDFTTSVVMQLTRPTTTYTTISRIIHSFDLDICAAAFNSKQVIISFSCLQALNSGHATCYALPISSSEFVRRVSRLFKYQQRGFNILCPKEFDINAFLATAVEDCKEIRSERIYRFRRQHFGDNCGSFSIQRNSVNIIIEINLKNM